MLTINSDGKCGLKSVHKVNVDEARQITAIGHPQKLTLSTLSSGELKKKVTTVKPCSFTDFFLFTFPGSINRLPRSGSTVFKDATRYRV